MQVATLMDGVRVYDIIQMVTCAIFPLAWKPTRSTMIRRMITATPRKT